MGKLFWSMRRLPIFMNFSKIQKLLSYEKLDAKLHEAILVPTLVSISQCVFAVNAVLTSAIRMHNKQVDKAYFGLFY